MKSAFIKGNDGKQVRIKRENTFEAFAKREALLRSTDLICLNQNEPWEYVQTAGIYSKNSIFEKNIIFTVYLSGS